jgi:DNA replication licensing factor MCM3
VGFTGELGANKLSPRKLLSSYLNHLVTVVGIVTKCSLVHPKMVRSVHYCQATRKFTTRHYVDETDLEGIPSQSNVMPARDEQDNPLSTEIGLCKFVDNQRVTLQELPETAPPGQLPRSTGATPAVESTCSRSVQACPMEHLAASTKHKYHA